MNNLQTIADFYFESGLDIIPVKGKRPFVISWTTKSFSNHKFWPGIGLRCGKRGNIICLDIDTLDKGLQKKILALLPPIYSGKQGNPNKLPSIFFQYNGEHSRDFKNIEVQILSDGKQTVLPPSPHPDFASGFIWVGRRLHEIDLDELPHLSKEIISALENLDQNTQVVYPNSGLKNSGRNNAIKGQIQAALYKGKDLQTIAAEVIEYDIAKHKVPLFSDKTEPNMKKDEFTNAIAMVSRIATSLVNSDPSFKIQRPPQTPPVVINIGRKAEAKQMLLSEEVSAPRPKTAPTPGSKLFLKYPKLPGLGDAVFNDLYSNAPIPRTPFSYMNALSLISILLSNKISYIGTLPNIYCYGVAPSGYGKDFPFKRVQKLLVESELKNLIGLSSLHSETALLKYLTNERNSLFPINEAEKIIKGIADKKRSFGLGEALTDVFDSSGKQFVPKGLLNHKGELQKFGDVFSPYLTVTMLSSDAGFQDNVSFNLFETGLLSRFLLFIDDRFKKQKFVSDYNPNVDPNLLTRIRAFYNLGRSEPPLVEDTSLKIPIKEAEVSPKSERTREKLFNSHQNSLSKEDQKFRGLLQRRGLHANKLALIHHSLSYESDYMDRPIQCESVEWGYETARVIHTNSIKSMKGLINEGGSNERLNTRILNYIKKRELDGQPTNRRQISNAMRGDKADRDKAIAELLDRGSVVLKHTQFYVGNL